MPWLLHPRRPRGSQSGAGEMARRKFSRTGGRTPGYQVSPDHFQTASRIPAPDWAEYKGFFLPNQEPVFAKPFGNGPVRLGTQGLRGCGCQRLFMRGFLFRFRRAREKKTSGTQGKSTENDFVIFCVLVLFPPFVCCCCDSVCCVIHFVVFSRHFCKPERENQLSLGKCCVL